VEYFKILMSNEEDIDRIDGEDVLEWAKQVAAILEIVLVTFLASLLPDLITLGAPPYDLEVIWKPLVSALIAALYVYTRIRNITVKKAE